MAAIKIGDCCKASERKRISWASYTSSRRKGASSLEEKIEHLRGRGSAPSRTNVDYKGNEDVV